MHPALRGHAQLEWILASPLLACCLNAISKPHSSSKLSYHQGRSLPFILSIKLRKTALVFIMYVLKLCTLVHEIVNPSCSDLLAERYSTSKMKYIFLTSSRTKLVTDSLPQNPFYVIYTR